MSLKVKGEKEKGHQLPENRHIWEGNGFCQEPLTICWLKEAVKMSRSLFSATAPPNVSFHRAQHQHLSMRHLQGHFLPPLKETLNSVGDDDDGVK